MNHLSVKDSHSNNLTDNKKAPRCFRRRSFENDLESEEDQLLVMDLAVTTIFLPFLVTVPLTVTGVVPLQTFL